MTTKAEKEHMGKVAALGCICCKLHHHVFTEAQVHHATGLKYRSFGKKASNFDVLPLCHTHHQGSFGIHHLGMRTWEGMFGSQEYLLAVVNQTLKDMQ